MACRHAMLFCSIASAGTVLAALHSRTEHKVIYKQAVAGVGPWRTPSIHRPFHFTAAPNATTANTTRAFAESRAPVFSQSRPDGERRTAGLAAHDPCLACCTSSQRLAVGDARRAPLGWAGAARTGQASAWRGHSLLAVRLLFLSFNSYTSRRQTRPNSRPRNSNSSF